MRGSPQNDELHGEYVHGYAGHDDIYLQKVGITHPTAHGGTGDDWIDGTSIADYIYGDEGDDDLYGGGGNNDRLYGGSGTDYLDGEGGSGDYCDCGPDDDWDHGPGCDTWTSCDEI